MIFDIIRDIFDLPPNNRIYQKGIATLRTSLNNEATKVIPWSEEETELLSLNELKIKLKTVKNSTAGVIQTIFHEPLVKFGIKRYRRKRDYGLALIQTSDREYVFIKLPNFTKVYLNDRALGMVNEQAAFYVSNKKKITAHIDQNSSPYNTIIFGSTPVGQVVNPLAEQSKNPRSIIQLVDLKGKDLDVFLCLCFYQWLTKIKKI